MTVETRRERVDSALACARELSRTARALGWESRRLRERNSELRRKRAQLSQDSKRLRSSQRAGPDT